MELTRVDSKPASAAESDLHFSYRAADPDAICFDFGNGLYEFFESAQTRIQEKTALVIGTTECVQAVFAQDVPTDGVFTFDIGRAVELVRILFPGAALPISERDSEQHTIDNAYFTLIGASVAAIKSIFPSQIYDAIDASDLRAWEKEHFLTETTDCVTMKVFRRELHRGTISVRVGYFIGFPILERLFR